jgi:hypothetical protein
MARAYSQDLRDRVIDAAFSGKSAPGSAAHFGVGNCNGFGKFEEFGDSLH